MSAPTICPRCGRIEAPESAYWYAMGRLHNRDRSKQASEEELKEVFDLNYCWSAVTGSMDGPYGAEYIFSYKDCAVRHQ